MLFEIYDIVITIFCVNSLAMHEESSSRRKTDDNVQDGAVPAYLLDRDNTTRAKACSCLERRFCLFFSVL